MNPSSFAGTLARGIVAGMLAVAMLALVGMMLVVVADVVLRQVADLPVRGAYDAVSILLCLSVFYGLAAVIAGRQEIVIDLIDSMAPARFVAAARRGAALISAVVLVFVFYAMIGPALDAWRYGDISLELRLPLWWVWAAALVGLAGGIFAALLAAVAPLPPECPAAEHTE